MNGSSVVNRDNDEIMFARYVEKIRAEVGKAADSWFHIAYYVYELDYFGYYVNYFNNIVECCQASFGFKKSTTYNFINIVEKFSFSNGTNRSSHEYIKFTDFMERVKNWSYSQLVAMLSLSEKQRELVTPDMSARDIKKLKADSKRLENEETSLAEIVVLDEPVSADSGIVLNCSHEIDELQQALDIALDDVSILSVKYDSKCRELNDIISARDEALQNIEKIKEQVKKLEAENKRLKAEIKSLKNSS